MSIKSPRREHFHVALYTTGGTIDGTDSEIGAIRSESDAAKWLSKQNDVHSEVLSILNKDSREITDEDRAHIIDTVRASQADAIILTHGTWTIAQTGRALKLALVNTNKMVLLVGAWAPFGEDNSDAPNQLEFALKELRTKRAGVWIAMDNQLFDPDKTEKVRTPGGGFVLQEIS